jgi:solute carrier family 25 (mitochondrial folate transporter), member 32
MSDPGREPPSQAAAPAADASALVYPRYAHAVAGAGGGLATVMLLHPLDTLKTRLQSDAVSRRTGALRVLRGILLREGPAALYRGSVPAAIGSVASWAFYMHWFHAARGVMAVRQTGAPPSAGADFLAGTSAGLLTAIATNPIWVVKVRLQLQRSRGVAAGTAAGPTAAIAYSGFLHGLRCIAREEGVRGLYRGLGPSLWLVSHGAIQFTLYERFKAALVARASSSASVAGAERRADATAGPSVRDSLVASTGSKLVAAAATYPIQLVRTRMQELGAGGDRYGDLVSGFARVLRLEGPRGLYRGLGANVARVMPQSAVTFVTYEQILKLCVYASSRPSSPVSNAAVQ